MLTDTKLRTLKARASALRFADANSLCIEVRPSGANVVLTDGSPPKMDLKP